MAERTIFLEFYLRPKEPSLQWWREQLDDVTHARVDVLNIMFWRGRRRRREKFFHLMLEVFGERKAAGKPNPLLALHHDGMGYGPLEGLDLDSEAGIDQFFVGFKEFFGCFFDHEAEGVLFKHGDAFPVFVYHPEGKGGVKALENALVAGLKERFRNEFGRELYLLFEQYWHDGVYGSNKLRLTDADNYYNWGASCAGIQTPRLGSPGFRVTTIGPGFDDTGRPGHEKNAYADLGWGTRVRDREGGDLFKREWEEAIRRRREAPWLLLEAWNLFIEGSEICPTPERGRLDIEICREYAPRFKRVVTSFAGAHREGG